MCVHNVVLIRRASLIGLVSLLCISAAWATPPSTAQVWSERYRAHRLKDAQASLNKGRAQRISGAERSRYKSTGEEVGAFDITEITARYVISDLSLPRRGTFSVTFTALEDGLNFVDLLRAQVEPIQVWTIRDGAQEQLRSSFSPVDWRLNIHFPPLTAGEVFTLWIRTDLVYNFEDSFGQVEEPRLAHHVGLEQLPVSYDYAVGDRFRLITEFEVEAQGVFPNAQGVRTVSGNPNTGVGSWRYETETTIYLMAMTLTDRPFARYSDRIDMSSPGSASGLAEPFFGFLASEIINSFTLLIAPFPFNRFTISTLSAFAGVAIGPQGMILMPEDYWFIDPQQPDDIQWYLESLMAHEIGHQYFPHLVYLQQSAPNWLSEAFAELMAGQHMALIYGHDYYLASNHWTYLYYNGPFGRPEPSVVSEELYTLELEDYFTILYLRGSCILHQLARRFDNFPEIFTAYVNQHQGRLVNVYDFIDALRDTGVPALARPSFDLNAFLNRYMFGSERFSVDVQAYYLNDEVSQIHVQPVESVQDSLELELRVDIGEISSFQGTYMSLEQPAVYQGSYQAAIIDPNREYFLYETRAEPADLDLNGVVDGLDVLEVLAREDLNIYSVPMNVRGYPERYFAAYDLNLDGVLNISDVENVTRALGTVNLAID